MEKGVTYGRLKMDAEERFFSLRRMLGVTSFGMNLILLEPGQRGRIHEHEEQEEVFLVLEGTLSLAVDGEYRDMGAGEMARVAPEVRRQVVNRGPGRCAILALGAAGTHVGRDGIAYRDWTSTDGGAPQEVPLPEDLPETEIRRE